LSYASPLNNGGATYKDKTVILLQRNRFFIFVHQKL